ncbi:primosomal protein N' [Aeribacillus pallidus]|uniref:Replication restart protein PriA n=1 Tax=Aeribacillus pallidus TaxID=33936 RepID=A0A223E8L2_9BACI|nr:primosomal protein N' [Aeribacillus pallidus]ASS91607.1 primosomal protein N' [Aeribacillus pallidus]
MRYASVVVDVPAKGTDKLFDYEIPNKFAGVIQPGMRVIVPFGSRKLTGFVVQLKNETDIDSVKPIHSLFDPEPVLNHELLELGAWLSETTLCYKITAFQAMLPAAMKTRYIKEIKPSSSAQLEDLPEEIRTAFEKGGPLSWEDLPSSLVAVVQKEIRNGNLQIDYRVEQRQKKRLVKYVKPLLPVRELEEQLQHLPARAHKQKEVIQFFIDHPNPILLTELTNSIQGASIAVKALIKKGILTEEQVEIYRDPYEHKQFPRTKPLPLTDEQKRAMEPILDKLNRHEHEVFLMYGVTGSGKTEIYLQAIEKVLNEGKEAIVLVPEISLTPQMVQRFKSRFGSQVAVLHSGLSSGEKFDEWRKIYRKEAKLVVGARSAIFAPFQNIGIIIIDEEHETSYKQEESPRYHARDVAIYRGKYHQCPVILGSATPTLESFARAQKGVYTLLTLKERVNRRPLPEVHIVDMREELRNGNRSMFSRTLFEKLTDRLKKGEQSVLLLNKRGYSSFVMCRNCGHVIGCPHCDISLTYHRHGEKLKCHYCQFETAMPSRCPECGSEHIRFFGTGTQRIEEELNRLIPEARVIRMDVDTTSRKGMHEKLLNAFGEKKADILLGTQMIAKGLDFPDVTLVGVLSADTMLHLPDFRSGEKTFQLLTQVSGRAGRHELPGEVVIQTYTPEHYSIQLASLHDFETFYRQEMKMRKSFAYPPYYFLILITVSHPNAIKAAEVTEKIGQYLKLHLSNEAQILGPVSSPIPKMKDRYRFQCMIKYKREKNLYKTLKLLFEHYEEDMSQTDLKLMIDLNPYTIL